MSDQATPASFKTGDIVSFTGYAQALPAGQKPNLEVGQKVELLSLDEKEGTWGVCLPDDATKDPVESLFPQEFEAVQQVAPAKKAAKKAAKPADKKADAPPPVDAKAAEKAAAKAAKEKEKADKDAIKAAEKEAKAKEKAEKDAAKAAEKAAKEAERLAAEQSEVIVDTATVTEAMTDAGGDLLGAAKSLVSRVKETYFTLGGVISHILKHRTWNTIKVAGTDAPLYSDDQAGFKAYVLAELGIDSRKAYDLAAIYKHFSKAGLDAPDVTSRIGWGKAGQIARIVGDNPDRVEEFIAFAEQNDRDTIDSFIKTVQGKEATDGQNPAPSKTRFSFSLEATKAECAKVAIETARKKLPEGANSESDAFSLITTEWATSNGSDVSLADMLDYIQTKYSVTLVQQVAQSESAEQPAQA